ncbi:MAG: YCF48-related protein [Candidatus Binatia bacterium]
MPESNLGAGRRIGVALAVALLAALPGVAWASWIATGPDGSIAIYDLLVDGRQPERLLAATSGGLFASADRGATWARSGIDDTRVYLVRAAPRRPDTLYAGTLDGVFRSADAGRSWARTSDAVGRNARALVLHPRRPATLYAGARSGVWMSVDGGRHWRQQMLAQRPTAVDAIAIDPRRPATLYAGTEADGVFKTTDGGRHWRSAGAGLPVGEAVFVLLVDPRRPETLYAGTSAGGFRSDDGGSTWQGVLVQPDLAVYALLFGGAAGRLYAATGEDVWYSDDGGETWTASEPRGAGLSALAADPTDATRVYAGAGALFVSDDAGASFRRHGTGLTNVQVFGLAVDPADPAIVYAATARLGLLQTADRGESWTWLGSRAEAARDAGAVVAIDPSRSATVFAAGDGDGMIRSTDGGASWRVVGQELPHEQAYAIAVSPRDANVVYVALSSSSRRDVGLWRSADGGTTWVPVQRFAGIGVRSLVFDPIDAGVIYAGANSYDVCLLADCTIFRSLDGGESWSLSSAGVDDDVVALVATADGAIYAGGALGGVFRSVDRAQSWTRLSGGIPLYGSTSLAADPTDRLALYAAAGDVFRTLDGGSTWSPMGIPHAAAIAVATDPHQPGRIFAGTFGGGVYRFDPQPSVPTPTPVAPASRSDHGGCQLVESGGFEAGIWWLAAYALLLAVCRHRRVTG